MNHNEIVTFLWTVADLIRDAFKPSKYQDVVLPLTELRQLDGLQNLDPQLRKVAA